MRYVFATMVATAVMFSGVPEVAAATSGLAYVEDTVFTVLDESVRVDTVAVMTNTTAERRSGNKVYYSYFDEMVLVVPADATELWVSTRGRSLTTTKEPLDDEFDLVKAHLPSQLRSGQSRTIEASFVLPRGEIRGEGEFFSNPAFHAFPLWSFSDPGTGSLALRVPQDAELGQFGNELSVTGSSDGYLELEPRDFSQPEEFFTYVTVTMDDALETTNFTVSGQDIVLRTWPQDDVWVNFARNTIERGLPTLETLIGLPVPDQASLEVTESVTPYFYGYGGWYDPVATSIEVGNELDDTVMIHELSHAWFNSDLFIERWVAEGLAEEMTWQAQRELDWPTEPLPRTPDPSAPGATPLIDWGDGSTSRLGDDAFRSQEEYGYNASWFTIHELVEIIGLDGIQEVIASANADTISYQGEDPTETTNKTDDWKRLIDLVSEAAGPEQEQAIEELFADYVLGSSMVATLDERRDARSEYADLLVLDEGWSLPRGIRESMTEWRFASARKAIAEAVAVQQQHQSVLEAAEAAGLDLSDAGRSAYESDDSDEPDFDDAEAILDEQLETIPLVEHVREAYGRPLNRKQRWGIGDVDLAPLVAYAEQAFANDDVHEIEAAQADLERTLAAAEAVGADRMRWAAIGSAASGLILAVLLWMSRRRTGTKASDFHQEDVVLSV